MSWRSYRKCQFCGFSGVWDVAEKVTCKSCEADIPSPRATIAQRAGFDDHTRKLLKIPFGKQALNFNSASDVDRADASFRERYKHLLNPRKQD